MMMAARDGAGRTRKDRALKANELIDAMSNERVEAAVDRTLRLRTQQRGAPLRSLASAAVEEMFCTCATGAADAVEHNLSEVRAALVTDVLQRAEKRLAASAPADAVECSSPPCMLHELDPAFRDYFEQSGSPAPSSPQIVGEDWETVRQWRKAMRSTLIERRLAMSPAERAARSKAITAALIAALSSSPVTLIGFFWPFKGEYDPRPLVRSLHAKGTRLALPVVVEKARPLIFREWWPGSAMTSGIWNIPVPAAGEPVSPDILLVPVVGFDKDAYRLGYGGGYYDRTLGASPARPRTIGVGFAQSQVMTIHPQPHDIPMDMVVTETSDLLQAVRLRSVPR